MKSNKTHFFSAEFLGRKPRKLIETTYLSGYSELNSTVSGQNEQRKRSH